MNIIRSRAGFQKLSLISLFVMGLLVSSFSAHAEDLKFNLINQTRVDMVGFFVSHSKADQWGENLIPDGYVLPPNHEIEVLIADGLETCFYDIRAEFADNDNIDDYDINICETGEYVFEE